jgi:dTMP kinase
LATRLDAVLTREPGGTAVGERIREVLLDPGTAELDPKAEALLMAAARAQHVHEVVRPALEDGSHVVTDRYIDSSLAYQGYGRGLDLGELRRISVWATDDLRPDLVVLLDVPAEVAAARLRDSAPDRIEQAGDDFHERVRAGFRALAASEPDRFVIVDGSGAEAAVAAGIWDAVDALRAEGQRR